MTFGMIIAKDVMVPMRDGVRLATDIYRPALDGEARTGYVSHHPLPHTL